MKRIWIITLFPDYFRPFTEMGVAANKLISYFGNDSELKSKKSFNDDHYFEIHVLNLRDYVKTKYKAVDDTPYGGGPGMLMRADILKEALEVGIYPYYQTQNITDPRSKLCIIFPSPRGTLWSQEEAKSFAHSKLNFDIPLDLVFICGRYEGIDERFILKYVDLQIALGDYILTGGELAVMTILDSAFRFVPGVLGNKNSSSFESFCDGLLEHPQYTRPRVFEEYEVPEVLMNGHHAQIEKYQKEERLRITKEARPDLWQKYLNQLSKK